MKIIDTTPAHPLATVTRSSKILDASGETIKLPVHQKGRLSDMSPTGRRRGIDSAENDRLRNNHFSTADGRPSDSIMAQDRETIENRLRYEAGMNNGTGKHIVESFWRSIIGTGPRIQIETGYPEQDAIIEREFADWAETAYVGDNNLSGDSLADGLIIDMRDCCLAGESLDVETTDNTVDTPVKYRLRGVEPKRLRTPMGLVGNENIVDGVEFDPQTGKVLYYYILDVHPHNTLRFTTPTDYRKIPADGVIHLFLRTEKIQYRGVPEFMSGLDVISQRRRWSLATLSAAESAADAAAVLTSASNTIEPENIESMDAIDWVRNMILTLPKGWDVKQMKAEHPTANHKEYDKSLIADAGRSLSMPYSVAAADASDANMSSARRDDLLFFVACRVRQKHIERHKLRRIFYNWAKEARLAIPSLAFLQKVNLRRLAFSVEWFWDIREPLDELKTQKSYTEGLYNESLSEIEICSKQGKDWSRHRDNILKVNIRRLTDYALLKEEALKLGLSTEEMAAALARKPATIGVNLQDDTSEESNAQAKK